MTQPPDQMTLRDYLCVPYTLLAEPVEAGDGIWLRQLSYPELGDFKAQGVDVEQVFLDIERQRMSHILTRLTQGDLPPLPRAPLTTADPGWWARRLGLSDAILPLLDKTAAEVRLARSN